MQLIVPDGPTVRYNDASACLATNADDLPTERTEAFRSRSQQSETAQRSQVQREMSRERPLDCSGSSAIGETAAVVVMGNKAVSSNRNGGFGRRSAGCGAGLLC